MSSFAKIGCFQQSCSGESDGRFTFGRFALSCIHRGLLRGFARGIEGYRGVGDLLWRIASILLCISLDGFSQSCSEISYNFTTTMSDFFVSNVREGEGC